MTDANPIDVHVGARIRLRRKQLGMSQQQLAERLSLTFQPVQKYERGSNRISASKMHRAATILGVEIDFFFEGLAGAEAFDVSKEEVSVVEFLKTREGLELSRAFVKLSPNSRRGVVALVRAMALDYV